MLRSGASCSSTSVARAGAAAGEARTQGRCRVEVEVGGRVVGAGEAAGEARAEGRCRVTAGVSPPLSAVCHGCGSLLFSTYCANRPQNWKCWERRGEKLDYHHPVIIKLFRA